MKHQKIRNHKCNFLKLHIIKNYFLYSLKNGVVKSMFTVNVFQILLFEVRLVLGHAERVLGSERVKFSVKNKKENSVFA